MKMYISLEITFDLDYIEECRTRESLIKVINKANTEHIPMIYTSTLIESCED